MCLTMAELLLVSTVMPRIFRVECGQSSLPDTYLHGNFLYGARTWVDYQIFLTQKPGTSTSLVSTGFGNPCSTCAQGLKP